MRDGVCVHAGGISRSGSPNTFSSLGAATLEALWQGPCHEVCGV